MSAAESWALLGTVGDTVGGLANLVTMGFVIAGFFWGRAELKRWRQQHAEEVRADAARTVYRTAHELLTEARLLRLASGYAGDDGKIRQHKQRLNELAERGRAAIADARLVLGESVVDALHSLTAATDRAVSFGDRRDRPESREVDRELDRVSSALLEVLRPYATLTKGAKE